MFTKIKDAIFTPKFSLRNVIFSFILGVGVAYVTLLAVYGAESANYIIKSIFKGDFYDSKSIARLSDKIVILGFAGLAVLYGNKAGLLNIGVSGQMVFGAFVGYFVVRQMGTTSLPVILIVGFIVTVLVSASVAALSGILKAFFKVNEVISTIMMNWIVVYLIKFFASNSKMSWYDSGAIDKIKLSKGINNIDTVGTTAWNAWMLAIIGISLFITTALVLWFVISKTSYGFKLQAVGKSTEASRYSGYNAKAHQVISMTISGALAGMGGFVMYFLSTNIIQAGDAPISEGFAGIAVSLVAMNNPIALVASAVAFGLLDGPTDGLFMGPFPASTAQIFAGVITYFVAISTMWMYIRPIEKMKAFKEKRSNKVMEVN